MRQTVFGIFNTANEAQNAVQNLLNSGFTESNIDVRAKNTSSQTDTNYNDTTGDSVSNFFGNLFGSDSHETRNYSEKARRGSVVTVHTSSKEESERAAEILDRFGAIDANDQSSGFRNDRRDEFSGSTETDKSIPIIEEKMEVGKREVESGGVRLRSRIIERPVEETLRLREEHVTVDRKPVDRAATEADFRNFKEGETEFTEHSEIPVVNKEARVVEEVNLNKETRERKETVRDSIRKTDVDVQKTNKDKENIRRDR